MIKRQLIITTFLSLILLNSQTAFSQIKGWSTVNQTHSLKYIPNDLPSKKTVSVSVTKPVLLKGRNFKKWFLKHAKSMQTSLGQPLQPWKIKADKEAVWSMSNMFINSNKKKLSEPTRQIN